MPVVPGHGEAYLSRWTTQGEHLTWQLTTGYAPVTLGRAGSCDISLAGDALISRLHATMERVGGQWTITDDGLSANGTLVNGRRIAHRVRLRNGDRIQLGMTTLTLCAPPPTEMQQTLVGAGTPLVTRLTEPQRAVLAALCRPYLDESHPYPSPASNQQIATELYLSLDSVKTHLRVLYGKFGIEDLPQNLKRARLAELALQAGLGAAR
jgi:pSer/pThr/pTyr-binding forkhead associated (FHA) protein